MSSNLFSNSTAGVRDNSFRSLARAESLRAQRGVGQQKFGRLQRPHRSGRQSLARPLRLSRLCGLFCPRPPSFLVRRSVGRRHLFPGFFGRVVARAFPADRHVVPRRGSLSACQPVAHGPGCPRIPLQRRSVVHLRASQQARKRRAGVPGRCRRPLCRTQDCVRHIRPGREPAPWSVFVEQDGERSLGRYSVPFAVDLGVDFQWKISGRVSLFAEGRNLLDRRLYDYPWYPGYRVNCTVGAKVSF